jgi:hypothetical protein
MPDKNWSVQDDGTSLLTGRYDLPGLAVEGSFNHEVRIALGDEEAFFNVFDLLEAVIYQAWRTDTEQTAQILGEAVLGGRDG